MTAQPKHNISIERATDTINEGLPLVDLYIDGAIELATASKWGQEVVIENCIVENLVAVGTEFTKPVRLVNSYFKNCNFYGAYFTKGLIIDNCTFDSYLDFQSGGHNKPGNPVIITNNNFKAFVNFFDCWYEGEVTISKNKFHKGTNVLGKPNNISVTFDVEPTITENSGQINFDHEGE
jgi:hypothetical protein